MIRDCLNVKVPDGVSEKLTADEEQHLVKEVRKMLALLSDKGTALKPVGRLYADAIDLEFKDTLTRAEFGKPKTTSEKSVCLLCSGTGKFPPFI